MKELDLIELFIDLSAAAKATPPGNKAYFNVAAELAACVLITVLAIPTALSPINAAACSALFLPAN